MGCIWSLLLSSSQEGFTGIQEDLVEKKFPKNVRFDKNVVVIPRPNWCDKFDEEDEELDQYSNLKASEEKKDTPV